MCRGSGCRIFSALGPGAATATSACHSEPPSLHLEKRQFPRPESFLFREHQRNVRLKGVSQSRQMFSVHNITEETAGRSVTFVTFATDKTTYARHTEQHVYPVMAHKSSLKDPTDICCYTTAFTSQQNTFLITAQI